MEKDKSCVIADIADMLLENNKTAAKSIISQEYPHTYYEIEKRTYTIAQKMNQFITDVMLVSSSAIVFMLCTADSSFSDCFSHCCLQWQLFL